MICAYMSPTVLIKRHLGSSLEFASSYDTTKINVESFLKVAIFDVDMMRI